MNRESWNLTTDENVIVNNFRALRVLSKPGQPKLVVKEMLLPTDTVNYQDKELTNMEALEQHNLPAPSVMDSHIEEEVTRIHQDVNVTSHPQPSTSQASNSHQHISPSQTATNHPTTVQASPVKALTSQLSPGKIYSPEEVSGLHFFMFWKLMKKDPFFYFAVSRSGNNF